MTASCRFKIFVSGEIDGAPGLLRATGANSSLKVNRSWNFRSSFIALCLYGRRSRARGKSISRAIGSRYFGAALDGPGEAAGAGGFAAGFSVALAAPSQSQASARRERISEILPRLNNASYAAL